jgi:hypothetical protein
VRASDKNIYGYKQPGAVIGLWVILVVVTVFVVAFVSGALFGEFTFNDHPASDGERAFGSIFVLLIGGVFIYAAAHGLRKGWKERIEFADGTIRWYDSGGRLRVECPEAAVVNLRKDPLYVNGIHRYEIVTSAGPIRFLDYIDRRAGLEDRIRRLMVHENPDAPRPRGLPPEEAVYRYRNPILLIVGVLFLGTMVFAYSTLFNGTSPDEPWLFVPMSIPFLMVPYFFLGAFFFERIEVGYNSISWYGRSGKVKVRSRFEDIESIDEQINSGENGKIYSARIYTVNGEIRVNMYLMGYRTLVDQLTQYTGSPPTLS